MPRLIPNDVRVIVRVDDPIGVTAGGLAIPDAAQKLPSRGVVVAIGKGDYRTQDKPLAEITWPDGSPVVPMPGTVIHFSKYNGTEIKWKNDKTGETENLLIIAPKDILAIEVEE